MEIKTTEEIDKRRLNLLWKVNNSNPSFKEAGQTEFTYDNYHILQEMSKDYRNKKWVAVDDVIKLIDKIGDSYSIMDIKRELQQS